MSPTAESSTAATPARRWLRRIAIAAGAFAALVVLAWLVVPPVVRSQLETRLTEALGRKTIVESVAFDPFRLRVTVRKLAIADADRSAPLLAFDELVADLSTASIWRWAPVLDALKVVRPAVSLARDREGRYNVQDLVDRARAELKARFLSRFAADVIAEDFPELAARMTQRTAVLDWHARQMELLAD